MANPFIEIKKELEQRNLKPSPHLERVIALYEQSTVEDQLLNLPLYKKIYYRMLGVFEAVFINGLFSKYFYKRIWYRIRYGFDINDTWSIDYSLAKWILPRLKYFKENTHSHPGHISAEEWDEILDKIIWSFEFYLDELFEYADEKERWKEGMDLFVEYYPSLWD